MKEIISIHIGQCGIQMGNSIWELFCLEHGIDLDGSLSVNCENSGNLSTLFDENSKGIFTPRAIFADLDPFLINDFTNGNLKNLINKNNIISGKEDSANNFCRGNITFGREAAAKILDKVRINLEKCDSFQGFTLFNSAGGGTGSGLTCKVIQKMVDISNKSHRIFFTVFPSEKISNTVVAPINTSLYMSYLYNLESPNANIVFDNSALNDICNMNLLIEQPTYSNINRLISQVVSSITSSMRFGGELNFDFENFTRNTIISKDVNYLVASFAPFISKNADLCEKTVEQITNIAFQSGSFMFQCQPNFGKYLAASLIYRGDVSPSEVNNAIFKIRIKNLVNFAEFIPTGIKCGLNFSENFITKNSEFSKPKKSVCLIANNTSITNNLRKIRRNMEKMFEKSAFLHWFIGEGMEMSELIEASENIARIEKLYKNFSEDEEEDDY